LFSSDQDTQFERAHNTLFLVFRQCIRGCSDVDALQKLTFYLVVCRSQILMILVYQCLLKNVLQSNMERASDIEM